MTLPFRCRLVLLAENRELRGAVIHLHDLQLRRHEDAQRAWAIRQQASDLGKPFSAEAVEERLRGMLETTKEKP